MSQHRHHPRFARMDDPDFDWSAAAEWLQLDGLIVMPLVNDLVNELASSGLADREVHQIIDVGSGPGVISCELARRFPESTVYALDSTPPLLQYVHDRAWSEGLSRRVVTATADLEVGLPVTDLADLAWVSMVIHHVNEPVAALGRIFNALRPGGYIVVTEFAGDPVAFEDSDPIMNSGTWQRLCAVSLAERKERLGFDFISHDWAADLAAAGFADVTDEVRMFTYSAPLNKVARQWLVRHLRRGLELAGDGLTPDDADAMATRADELEQGKHPAAFLTSERRVLIATRPN